MVYSAISPTVAFSPVPVATPVPTPQAPRKAPTPDKAQTGLTEDNLFLHNLNLAFGKGSAQAIDIGLDMHARR